ncbi:MAG: hypothetical protein GY938_08980 [Ketobacter sp.]|nr:hypothetical protein [Ketobacter sp.]
MAYQWRDRAVDQSMVFVASVIGLSESKGGAVCIGSNSNIVFEHSMFDTNEADLYGGAVYFSEAKIGDVTKQCLLTAEMDKSAAGVTSLQSTFAESDCNAIFRGFCMKY